MAVLSPAQLASVLRAGGFSVDQLPEMVAAGLAESGGDSSALNDNPATGDKSYGVMQVNMLGDMGPERRRQFGISSNEELFNPLVNARAAHRIYQSQGPNAWSVIRSGAHRQHLPAARAGVEAMLRGEVGELPTASPPSAAGAPLGGAGSPFAAPSNPMAGLTQQLLSSFAPKSLPVANTLGELAALGLETSFAEAAGLKGRGSRGTRMALSPEFIAGYSDLKQRQQEAGGDLLSQSISRMFGPQAVSTSPVPPQALSGGPSMGGDDLEVDIVTLGRALQGKGFKVAEHSAFGGVGRHSPNSHHYRDHALDLTIQAGSPLLAGRPDSDWRALTAKYGRKLRDNLPGAEIFHPEHDPVGGHHEHIHLGIPGGRIRLNPTLRQFLGIG